LYTIRSLVYSETLLLFERLTMTNSNGHSDNYNRIAPLKRKALAAARKALRAKKNRYTESVVQTIIDPGYGDVNSVVGLMYLPVIGTWAVEWLYQNFTGPGACESEYVLRSLQDWENCQNAQLIPVDLRDPEN